MGTCSIILDVLQSIPRGRRVHSRKVATFSLLETIGARATQLEPGPPYQETRISGWGKGRRRTGRDREVECVTTGACRAGDTLAWTCVLLWPIVARVIKIFEPMNIPRFTRRGHCQASLVVDEYRRENGTGFAFVTVLKPCVHDTRNRFEILDGEKID